MDWSYSDLTLEDLLEVIKGFIDMLILASGYQSSGLPAHWDSPNIKKAFQWAILIEDVLRCWKSSADHQDTLAELDAALSEIISNPCFPQGLKHISSASLSQARNLILRHLIHTLPLRDTHLRATMAVIVEVDVQEIQRISSDALNVYFDRLMHDAPKDPISTGSIAFTGNRSHASPEIQPSINKNSLEGGFTMCAVRELGRRQLEVSRLSIAETGLDVLSTIMRKSYSSELGATWCGEKRQLMTSFLAEEKPVDPEIWSLWKSRSLSYLLDKRTSRMVSGAKLLLSAPKHQWVEVIRRMDVSDETDDYCEKTELLLFGSISSKWSSLIGNIVSSSYKCVTISKLYREVQDLLFRRLQNPCSEDNLSAEEKGAHEHLEDVLGNQVHCLWKLLPVLPAMAIPLRSPLFRSYLAELESRIRGDSSAIRCCSCTIDGKNHTECELAERIWCLYIFHSRASRCEPIFAIEAVKEPQKKKPSMKFSSILRLKKIQFQVLKWERIIGCSGSGSGVALGSVERRIQVRCGEGSFSVAAKHLVWRLKSQWKPALRWQRSSNTSRYSYDPRGYSQNFDDGCCNDHRSPLAPCPT